MSPRLTDAQIDARVVVLRGIRESGHDQGCDCALCIAVALADRASRSSSGSGEAPAPDDLEIERLLDAVLDASYAVEQTEGDRTKERRAFDEARRALLQGIGKAKQEALAPWVRAAKASGSGEREALEAEVAKLTAQRTMTVHRLGGEVEGAPTHAGNFLQRIDALRAIEADSGERVRALEEALRETRWWGHANNPETWCWCDHNGTRSETGLCVDPGCALARRALSPQGDGTGGRS